MEADELRNNDGNFLRVCVFCPTMMILKLRGDRRGAQMPGEIRPGEDDQSPENTQSLGKKTAKLVVVPLQSDSVIQEQ